MSLKRIGWVAGTSVGALLQASLRIAARSFAFQIGATLLLPEPIVAAPLLYAPGISQFRAGAPTARVSFLPLVVGAGVFLCEMNPRYYAVRKYDARTVHEADVIGKRAGPAAAP